MKLKIVTRVLKNLVTHPAAESARLAPLLRWAKWQAKKRISPSPIVINAFGGRARLKCYPDNAASNAVIYFEWPDWDVMRMLSDLLRPGDWFLDAGANVGVYSALAAGSVGTDGRVIAFEPNRQLVPRLRENLALNGQHPDDAIPVGLGAEAGVVAFFGSDSTGHLSTDEGTSASSVEVERLDALVEYDSRIVVGKMDVEGFELAAMRGTSRLLEQGAPKVWIVETNNACSRYGDTRADLQDYLNEFGYSFYQLVGHSLVRVPAGGPFPFNSIVLNDLDWWGSRLPEYVIQ